MFFAVFFHAGNLLGGSHIGFVAGNNLGASRQFGAIHRQLFVNGFKILNGVSPFAACYVHNVNQQPTTFHVAQELVTQSHPFAGAFNQTGNVRHYKGGTFSHTYHPKGGSDGGKVVVGNLGFGFAYHRNQGGFAHIGEAQQPYVCQQFQFQLYFKTLPGGAAFGKAGRLTGGSGKMAVAPAAATAFGNHKGFFPRNVCQQSTAFHIFDQRAVGNQNYQILTVFAKALTGRAVLSVFGSVFPLVAKIRQSRQIGVGFEHNVAAFTAVAAIGTACRYIFFAAKRNAAVAAVACFDFDFCHINKHIHLPPKEKGRSRTSIPSHSSQ